MWGYLNIYIYIYIYTYTHHNNRLAWENIKQTVQDLLQSFMLESSIQNFSVNIYYFHSPKVCSSCQARFITLGRRRHLLFGLLWGSLPTPLWLQNPGDYVKMRQDAWVNIYVITKYIYLIVDKTSVSPEMTSSFFIQSFEAIMEANNVGRRDWKREITLIMKMFH